MEDTKHVFKIYNSSFFAFFSFLVNIPGTVSVQNLIKKIVNFRSRLLFNDLKIPESVLEIILHDRKFSVDLENIGGGG